MDYKFNLQLLILCFSLSAVRSANEDVQLTQRYIVTQHFGRDQIKNSGPSQVEQIQLLLPNGQTIDRNVNLSPGSNRVGKAQNFVQYQPAASYQIIETPNNQQNVGKNNGGTTIQFPLTSTTATYRISNGQEQVIKQNVQDDLLSLINLVENTGSNQRPAQSNQVNRVQNVAPNYVQNQPPQRQNQPQIQYQQVSPQVSNQPQIQYQVVQPSQSSNQPQIQTGFQNQPQGNFQPQNSIQQQNQRPVQNPQIQYPQNPATQNQFLNRDQFVYTGNGGNQNQLPNRYAAPSPSIDQKIDNPDDDKIGKLALISVLGK